MLVVYFNLIRKSIEKRVIIVNQLIEEPIIKPLSIVESNGRGSRLINLLSLLSLLEIEYVNMVYKLASVLILMIEVSETS